MTRDEYKRIAGYRLRISEAWEASYICEYEIKFPRYNFFIIQFWLLHYSIEMCYKALLLEAGIKQFEGHSLVNLHNRLIKEKPAIKKIVNFEKIQELDKFGKKRGGIRYPEEFPTEWQHTNNIWHDLEPFKSYTLIQTYRHSDDLLR